MQALLHPWEPLECCLTQGLSGTKSVKPKSHLAPSKNSTGLFGQAPPRLCWVLYTSAQCVGVRRGTPHPANQCDLRVWICFLRKGYTSPYESTTEAWAMQIRQSRRAYSDQQHHAESSIKTTDTHARRTHILTEKHTQNTCVHRPHIQADILSMHTCRERRHTQRTYTHKQRTHMDA